MSAPRTVPGAGDALATIAGLTLKRLLRGRIVWFVVVTAGMPALIALAMRGRNATDITNDTLVLMHFLFAILSAMLVAHAIGDELGSKTATYLWSRPVPRWTILIGKLLVLAPLTAVILVGSWWIALLIGGGFVSGQALFAVALGALATSAIVATIATVAPRFGTAFALLYLLLIDVPLALLPVSVRQLSVVYQTHVVASLPFDLGDKAGSAAGGALWLVAMSAIWLAVALRSLRTREA